MAPEVCMFHGWLTKEQDERHTPVEASSVIQGMHAEIFLPPSLEASTQNHENLDLLLQNMTPIVGAQ